MASPTEIAALEIRITGVENAISQFSNFQQTTTKTMSASEAAVTRSLKNMVSQFIGLAAVARSVQSVVSSGVGFDQFVENTTMSFTVMMKSADKAKQQMKDLYDFAVASPLTFKETASSSKQLMAYGFTAEELIPTMKTLGSVAIATGHSLDDISYVYGTLKSQGRAYSRDLMQFGMRGIPIYEELAKVMGVNVTQIQKLASEGKIGFAEVETAFQNMTTGSGRFSGIIEGYMTTLTGKLSMLSDIGQQSMGTLMSSVTDQLKLFVDAMTKDISSDQFQAFIKDASVVLGVLAGVLAHVLELLVSLLPVVSSILKVIALPVAVVALFALIQGLPGILMGIGTALTALATEITAVNSQLVATAAAESAAAMGAAAATSGMAALSESLTALAAANPWLLALVAIAAVGGAIITIVNKQAEQARQSSNSDIRASQLYKDYHIDNRFMSSNQLERIQTTTAAGVDPSQVAKIAEQYRLTEGETANILKNTNALSANAWQQYLNTKSANAALIEQEKIAVGLRHVSTTIEQDQMAFLSNLTGKNASVYEDLSNVDLNAKGNQGAKDYIAGFAETRAKEKDIFGFAYSSDQLKKSLEDEAKGLTSALEEGSKVKGLFDTHYDETLRARLSVVNKELDGLGEKAKALKLIDIPKWWLPDEAATAATSTAIDDAELAAKKSLVSTEAEIEARKKALESNLALTSSMDNGAEKTKLQVSYMTDLVELEKKRQKILDDIAKKTQKDIDVAKYNELISGKSGFWTDLEANVANNMDQVAKKIEKLRAMNKDGSSAIDKTKQIGSIASSYAGAAAGTAVGAIQGTEVGNVLAGGNPILNAVLAIAQFALSIEAVQKVLNPVKTVLEQARSVLEPLITAVLEPMTNTLEMSGDLLKQLLPPILGIIKILNNTLYLFDTWVLVPLQMLGAGFEWFYNYIIVPVANAIVNIVNAIIRVLNKIPFVHIKYLSSLSKMDMAVQSLTETINKQKSALDQTITYLTDKINNAIDDQLTSLQDLYEAGAITATNYEAQVKVLNAQKINSDDILVSMSDMSLTGADIYDRLYALYDLKDAINNGNLTDAQIADLLDKYGLASDNEETLIKNAVLAALTAYNASTGTSSATGTTPTSSSETVVSNITGAIASIKSYSALIPYLTAVIASNNTTGTHLANVRTLNAEAIIALNNAWDLYKASMAAASSMGIDTSGYTSFAVGTGSVPYDMTAQIHKGEGIVPSTFMDSIRSGELALSSGKNEGAGQNLIVNVTVEGSVQTENDLATSIAQAIYVQRSRGALTV